MDSKGLFTSTAPTPRREGLQLRPRPRLRRTSCCAPRSASELAAHRALVSGDVSVQLRHRQPARRRPRLAGRPDVGQRPDDTQRDAVPGKWGAAAARLRRASGFLGAHAKWRITRVEHGLRPRARRADRRRPRRRRRRTRRPTRASGTGRRLIVEKRFGSTGQFQHRAERRLPRALRERHDPRPRATASTSTATSSRTAAASAVRVLEPLDLVAETYGTYLLSGTPTRRRSCRTRPSAASSSSSSATRT